MTMSFAGSMLRFHSNPFSLETVAMSPSLIPPCAPVLGLHHFAWRCRDAEETRHFYEDILGMPLVHLIHKDTVPSTGEYCPYVHIFFRMHDG